MKPCSSSERGWSGCAPLDKSYAGNPRFTWPCLRGTPLQGKLKKGYGSLRSAPPWLSLEVRPTWEGAQEVHSLPFCLGNCCG